MPKFKERKRGFPGDTKKWKNFQSSRRIMVKSTGNTGGGVRAHFSKKIKGTLLFLKKKTNGVAIQSGSRGEVGSAK